MIKIDNGNCVFVPAVCSQITYEGFSRGRCAVVEFDAVEDSRFPIREGDFVSLADMFFGMVFKRREGSDSIVRITAYDQLRYLKNRDTYVYSNRRASDVVRMIALDYKLRLGHVEETLFVIPHRIEDNATLNDVIHNALDLEYEHSGNRFVLTDDFGRLSLKSEAQAFSGVVLNRDTVGQLTFFSSVDSRCNRVKISRSLRDQGREIAIAADGDSESRLGILQHYARSADRNTVLAEKARRLLKIYNRDSRSICVKNAVGDCAVRGGSFVLSDLDEVKGYARVNRCVHRICDGSHFMDLEVTV
jgi:hypothetical protein